MAEEIRAKYHSIQDIVFTTPSASSRRRLTEASALKSFLEISS